MTVGACGGVLPGVLGLVRLERDGGDGALLCVAAVRVGEEVREDRVCNLTFWTSRGRRDEHESDERGGRERKFLLT